MKTATLCIFQYPEALAEIEFWENTNSNKIWSKAIVEEDFFIYNMKDYKERVICINKDNLKKYEHLIHVDLLNNFNKLLLFGKFNCAELQQIINLVSKYEK